MKKPPVKNPKTARKLPAATFESRFNNTLFSILVLASLTFVVYSRTLLFGYTKLDDSIFIVENASYNADAHNIAVSFKRGLFNPTRDVYYRPLFLVDFILESRLFGVKPAGYHFTNLLFHILSVCLLFLFLKKIKIPPADSFLLSLLFALHPVLTQAVAWIPGRNDMLLMIFFLTAFLLLIRYLEKPSPVILALHVLALLAALFTKETAIIIPVIMAIFSLTCLKPGWKKLLMPIAGWIMAMAIWMLVRSTATLSKDWTTPGSMLMTGLGRIGVIVQYVGKIFIPVNLTVFPETGDITMIWGFVAIAGFVALIVYSKSYSKPLTWLGLFWFILFLMPVLIVPKSLNDQVFEHRLYLPMIGILLMLSQTLPFGKTLEPGKKLAVVVAIVLLFSVQSFVRSAYFSDPLTFWTHAVEGSPHSAFARTLLGTKVEDPADRERLFREAYRLDPNLKNLNYYLGKVLFSKHRSDSAEYYFRKELLHNPLPDVYFLMAQIAFERNSLDSAAVNLVKTIEMDPLNPQANHNLALLYHQQGRDDKLKQLLQEMQMKGMAVEEDLLKLVK